MDSTSVDVSAPNHLQTALPSQAHELLTIERRERERVRQEQEELRAQESSLENELAVALRKEEEAIASEGMRILQDFKQKDLSDLLKKEGAAIERDAESIKNSGLANVKKAAALLANAALSKDVLSRL